MQIALILRDWRAATIVSKDEGELTGFAFPWMASTVQSVARILPRATLVARP
jgi:hypothetical protein